jgi:hypothetical protein
LILTMVVAVSGSMAMCSSSATVGLLFLRRCGGGKVEIEQVGCFTRWNMFLYHR